MKKPYHYTLFNFGRRNHLALSRVCDDVHYDLQVAWWLSGRVFGCYVSYWWNVGTPDDLR